jgi:hypothetical protein
MCLVYVPLLEPVPVARSTLLHRCNNNLLPDSCVANVSYCPVFLQGAWCQRRLHCSWPQLLGHLERPCHRPGPG